MDHISTPRDLLVKWEGPKDSLYGWRGGVSETFYTFIHRNRLAKKLVHEYVTYTAILIYYRAGLNG
jgi:hypothetical protein